MVVVTRARARQELEKRFLEGEKKYSQEYGPKC